MAEDQTKTEQKRVVVYIPDQDHRQLRSKLALKGLSVSEWVRTAVKEYLDKE